MAVKTHCERRPGYKARCICMVIILASYRTCIITPVTILCSLHECDKLKKKKGPLKPLQPHQAKAASIARTLADESTKTQENEQQDGKSGVWAIIL